MCLISSLYEARQQKKAAKEAQKRSKIANANAAKASDAEKKIAAAQQAAEATPATDIEAAAALSASRRNQGVNSTYLNKTLG